jgi:hypothetical protein
LRLHRLMVLLTASLNKHYILKAVRSDLKLNQIYV